MAKAAGGVGYVAQPFLQSYPFESCVMRRYGTKPVRMGVRSFQGGTLYDHDFDSVAYLPLVCVSCAGTSVLRYI